jgi:hypothetical protein
MWIKSMRKEQIARYSIIALIVVIASSSALTIYDYPINPLYPSQQDVNYDWLLTFPYTESGEQNITIFVRFIFSTRGIPTTGEIIDDIYLIKESFFISPKIVDNISFVQVGFPYASNSLGNYNVTAYQTLQCVYEPNSKNVKISFFQFKTSGDYNPRLDVFFKNNTIISQTFNNLKIHVWSTQERLSLNTSYITTNFSVIVALSLVYQILNERNKTNQGIK